MSIYTDNVKGLFELKNNHINIGGYHSDREIIFNYGYVLKNRGKSSLRYCCFNYALNDRQIDFLDDAVDILYEEYIEINRLKDMQKGDIILFYDDFEATHLAKIIKTDGTIQGTIVKAKFGTLGIYEHKLKNTPTSYGDKFVVFRKK